MASTAAQGVNRVSRHGTEAVAIPGMTRMLVVWLVPRLDGVELPDG